MANSSAKPAASPVIIAISKGWTPSDQRAPSTLVNSGKQLLGTFGKGERNLNLIQPRCPGFEIHEAMLFLMVNQATANVKLCTFVIRAMDLGSIGVVLVLTHNPNNIRVMAANIDEDTRRCLQMLQDFPCLGLDFVEIKIQSAYTDNNVVISP